MIGTIEIETRSLRQDRDMIQEQTERLRAEVTRLSEAMEELAGMWEGPAKESFQKQFRADYDLIQEFLGEMDQYVQAMSYAEQEYDKCEAEVGELVASIRI